MIQNYFTIAWRNLIKNKTSSYINIGGLAVGMATALLIGLWVYDELTFNQYHQNYNSIAQVMQHMTFDGQVYTQESLPVMIDEELKSQYKDEFRYVAMASPPSEHILLGDEKMISARGIYMGIDAPKIFTLKMLKGSREGLKDQNSILLSQSTSRAIFADKNPLDQLITIDNQQQVKVTGVYEDLPLNSRFQDLKFIAPWDLFVNTTGYIKRAKTENQWDNNSSLCFVQMHQNADMEKASQLIKNVKFDKVNDQAKKNKPELFLNPMREWHLRSTWENGVKTGGRITYVWIFSLVGCFVLALACINFMNLTTARSEKRSKEVGIRKAIGSSRINLVYQFFGESMLSAGLSFGIALGLVLLSLKSFNAFAAKQIELPFAQPYFWMASIVFIGLIGFLAGIYPAIYLSSFKPIKVLKGTFSAGKAASMFRKSLVVIQFTVSIVLMLGFIIIYKQIQMSKNRPMGYAQDGLIMMEMKANDFREKYEVLRTELKNSGVVVDISKSMGKVTQVYAGAGGFAWKGKDPELEAAFGALPISANHGKTIGWEVIAGRDFKENSSIDSSGIVMNEAAAKLMNLEHPIGEPVSWKTPDGKYTINFHIIGVVKDMVMESPYEPSRPTLFFLKEFTGFVNWLNIKINPAVNTAQALPQIEKIFKKVMPAVPFEYQFVDEDYQAKFKAEAFIGKLATLFALLAIFISCLGVFGLASFMAEQRTKEIGIRKVLGANLLSLWQLLSKDFVLLVLISCLIATPIAYYFMSNWLETYTYRTEISWWIFVAAGVGILAITLLTVSYQTLRATLANPIQSLRSE